MKRLYTFFAVLFLSGLAGLPVQAMPEFWATFQQTYAVKSGTPIGQAKCVTCHVAAGPPARNPYGKMVEEAMQSANAKFVTPAILHSIENKDADGDGFTNGEEIAAGTLPGDPKSHRDAPPPGGTHASGKTMPGMSGHMAAPGANPPSGSSLFPLHSFHPQIVHFPIALFLFGGFLAAMFGFGNNSSGGANSDSYLLEANLNLANRNTIFSRFEFVNKKGEELALNPMDRKFGIGEFTIGYVRDFTPNRSYQAGVGAAVTFNMHPSELDSVYGSSPMGYWLFFRIRPASTQHGGSGGMGGKMQQGDHSMDNMKH